jgi:two-component system chemotaxis response regulator CheB
MIGKTIKVLLVEDSVTVLRLQKQILSEDPLFEVIGAVANGKLAVEFVAKYKPDVISMDIQMPEMDGLEATRHIMYHNPVPIVIVSSLYDPSDILISFNILKAGALTILPKPYGFGHPQYSHSAREYRNTLKMMAGIKVSPQQKKPESSIEFLTLENKKKTVATQKLSENIGPFNIIAIGASAGGPMALQTILSAIPPKFPVPIIIVQHIDQNFAEGFCDWLNSFSTIRVNIPKDGDILLPGYAYIPPGDSHLGFHKKGIVKVTKDPPENNLRPSVSYLFNSLANAYGKHAIAVLLSGMGKDGANELKMLFDLGAITFAQNEDSSLVHGMPGEAIRLGGASLVLSPENIVNELVKIYNL